MSIALLPSNNTQLERLAAQALAQIERVPVPIRDLLSPTRCPVELLPYLAWAFSVDRWESSWSEATKRQVIASAYYVHAHKGTIGALRRVVEPLGYLLSVTEWWQEKPEGVPGTFRLDIGVLESGITEEMFESLTLLIDDAKPVSRHLTGLAIVLETRGRTFIGATALHGDTTTVYPYEPGLIEVSAPAILQGGTAHIIDIMSVYP
ncbi:phage tail protein I [Pseudomonas sp. URMO17WK12:I2]|uniref:phage tail protein I n=1 Tax=Pseudomonas sp. URMO17WK12:I2 TaxID=1261623 RepID=UPI000DAD0C47|nr:phage tail protein I [Pseudomonas sp. URMO17WK12:I2]PZW46381.1 phage tail P2-like protein [Pseudomonas sp. URMO17WK12:I2]